MTLTCGQEWALAYERTNVPPMNKCPKCGHTWPDEKRAMGGKARWTGLTKLQRSAAARKFPQVRHGAGVTLQNRSNKRMLVDNFGFSPSPGKLRK